MKHRHPARYALLLAILVGLATYAYADGFAPPQGSGGGGAAQTPWTGNVDAAGYLLQFGGTTSTYPAMKYGSAAGRIDLTRADGSDGSILIRNGGNNQNLQFEARGSGTLTFSTGTGNQVFDYNSDEVAVVGSRGLTVNASGYALQLVDQGSAPTVTAGYGGIYVLNSAGSQLPKLKIDSAALALGVVGCSLYHAGGDTSLSSGASVAAPYDTEHFDTHAFHDTSSNNTRVTIPPGLDGLYEVRYHQRLNVTTPGASKELFGWVRKNGSTTAIDGLGHTQECEAYNYLSGTAVLRLVGGDYIELMFYGETSFGGSGQIDSGNATLGTFTVTRIAD